jgi:hypothetical protein
MRVFILTVAAVLSACASAQADEARYTTAHTVELHLGAACTKVWSTYADRAAWMSSFVSSEPQPSDGQGAASLVMSKIGEVRLQRIERVLASETGKHLATSLSPVDGSARAFADLSLRPAGKSCDLQFVLFVDVPYSSTTTADRAAERTATATGTKQKIEADLRKLQQVVEKKN